MTEPSAIFDHHYAQYLKQLEHMDLQTVAGAAGAGFSRDKGGEILTIPYFNALYTLSSRGIYTARGEKAAYETCAILSRYLIMADACARRSGTNGGDVPSQTEWTGFRDLKDAGPLTVYFRDNVELALSRLLAGRSKTAVHDLAVLAPEGPDLDARYDVMLAFKGLPNIPLLLLFNDSEDGFPATCSVLFRADVESHLDAECIAMMGYRLADLVRSAMDSPGPAVENKST